MGAIVPNIVGKGKQNQENDYSNEVMLCIFEDSQEGSGAMIFVVKEETREAMPYTNRFWFRSYCLARKIHTRR